MFIEYPTAADDYALTSRSLFFYPLADAQSSKLRKGCLYILGIQGVPFQLLLQPLKVEILRPGALRRRAPKVRVFQHLRKQILFHLTGGRPDS